MKISAGVGQIFMTPFSYFLFTLFFIQSITSASSIPTTAEETPDGRDLDLNDSWDPKKDPVYNPVAKCCWFENNPYNRFTVGQYLSTEDSSGLTTLDFDDNAADISVMFPSYSEDSTVSSFSASSSSSDSPAGEVQVAEQASVPKPKLKPVIDLNLWSLVPPPPAYFDECLHLIVPVKCVNYERKWDFFFGDQIRMDSLIVGWVSRIGYADHIIHEMGFPMQSASYTLIPHLTSSKDETVRILRRCKYAEIKVDSKHLFIVLYRLSNKSEKSTLINAIAAVRITFDIYSMVSIKIFVKPSHEEFAFNKLRQIRFNTI